MGKKRKTKTLDNKRKAQASLVVVTNLADNASSELLSKRLGEELILLSNVGQQSLQNLQKDKRETLK